MLQPLTVLIGKSARLLARMRGGSGSAFPGLVAEKIDPGFVKRTLAQAPHGVVLVSGTNGKTTTTKMVVELLTGQGMRVFTNRTGSNFTRGVAAALLGEVTIGGHLDADVAVLELDEAYAVKFAAQVPPRNALLLNVMRDQLDRFGEIDHTADLLRQVAARTTAGVVLNREDPRVAALAQDVAPGVDVRYFGLSPQLLALFPSDDALHSTSPQEASDLRADVELVRFFDDGATYRMGGTEFTAPLQINGLYNLFNAAAAIALTRQVRGANLDVDSLLSTLSQITPAFGRGETIVVHGQPVELVLVKNPGGFRLGLKSFAPEGYATMIAINDNYADGRDMSWLWDVDFTSLSDVGVDTVSGVRAYDMALRLTYDQVPHQTVSTDLTSALHEFLDRNPGVSKRIYCTYTAMLALRRELARITEVKGIDE